MIELFLLDGDTNGSRYAIGMMHPTLGPTALPEHANLDADGVRAAWNDLEARGLFHPIVSVDQAMFVAHASYN